MKDSDVINVYWSPVFRDMNSNIDWNILYPDPINLFTEKISKKSDKGTNNFFACPAVKNYMKNIYVFKNTVDSEYYYDFTNGKQEIVPISSGYLDYKVTRGPSINTGPLIVFNMSYILFSDHPLVATFTSPFFSESEYTKYGSLVPGEYDIGQWFRPYNCELQLWSNSGNLKFMHDEPLLYIKFNTDKKIKMHRFIINEKLNNIVNANINIIGWYKTKNLLSSYYYLFNRSSMKNIVLKEIKKNLVGDYNDREI